MDYNTALFGACIIVIDEIDEEKVDFIDDSSNS